MFILTLLQIFYPMMLIALKRLNESDKPSKLWVEIIKVVVLSVFLIFTFLFMLEKREEVDDDAFKEKYGAYLTSRDLSQASSHPLPGWVLVQKTVDILKFNLVT
jgi:hypothetical protein